MMGMLEDYFVCNNSIIPQEHFHIFENGKKLLASIEVIKERILILISELENNELNIDQIERYKDYYNTCNDQLNIIYLDLKTHYDSLIRPDEGFTE